MKNSQANTKYRRLFYLFAGITTGSSLLLASFEYRAFEAKAFRYDPILPSPVIMETFLPPAPEKPVSLPKAVSPKLKDLSDIIKIEPDLVELDEFIDENLDGIDNIEGLNNLSEDSNSSSTIDLGEEVEALFFPEIIATYGNCEGIEDYQEKLNCTQNNVMSYIQKTVKYDLEMIRKGVQGLVAVEYVVDENGNVNNVTLIKGIHQKLDQQVIEAISNMGSWKPARQGPHKVKQRYITSVKFQLN
ncbi:MAG TPA: energy transducer TonB [Bacteroidia bacterium]